MSFELLLSSVISILFEPFPLSSSGHALLAQVLYKKFFVFSAQLIPSYYNYIVHGPVCVVLFLFFWRDWLYILKVTTQQQRLNLFFAGVITEIMTVLWYVFFAFFGNSFFPLPLGFFITGLLLLSTTKCSQALVQRPFDYGAGVLLGCAQGLALLPGISRFGATFAVARWLKFSPHDAFVYSFLIEFPISFAGFFKGIYMMYHIRGTLHELLNLSYCLVILVSMLFCYGGFCVMQKIVHQNRLELFGYYLIALSLLIVMLNVC